MNILIKLINDVKATLALIKAKADLFTETHASRIDATISSRASQTTVDAIKAKTDLISSAAMSGSVNKVQRGVAVAAGTITISAVNMAKAMTISVSKGSAGSVAVSGTINLKTDGSGPALSSRGTPENLGSISGGTTNLTVKEYSARLTSSTQLTCDGPVEWQVIEFY